MIRHVAFLFALSGCLGTPPAWEGTDDETQVPDVARRDAVSDSGTNSVSNGSDDVDPPTEMATETRRDVSGDDADVSTNSADGSVEVGWLPGYGLRRSVSVRPGQVDEDLTDFPLLVAGGSEVISDDARPDGLDLEFTAADGVTPLSREIESFDDDAFAAWVLVPNVSSTVPTTLYVYWDGPEVPNAGSAVFGDYEYVYHLAASAADSVSQTLGQVSGAPAFAPGVIGSGAQLDGVDDVIDTGNDTNLQRWTVSAWVQGAQAPASADVANGALMRQENYQITWDHFAEGARSATSVHDGEWHTLRFSAELEANTWYHLVATYDGDTLRTYVDGDPTGSNDMPSGPSTPIQRHALIGRHAVDDGAGSYFEGQVDEVRASGEVRSPASLLAEYRNQSDPASFLEFGPIETR